MKKSLIVMLFYFNSVMLFSTDIIAKNDVNDVRANFLKQYITSWDSTRKVLKGEKDIERIMNTLLHNNECTEFIDTLIILNHENEKSKIYHADQMLKLQSLIKYIVIPGYALLSTYWWWLNDIYLMLFDIDFSKRNGGIYPYSWMRRISFNSLLAVVPLLGMIKFLRYLEKEKNLKKILDKYILNELNL